MPADGQPRDSAYSETWGKMGACLDTCRRAHRTMDFVLFDPCSKTVDTRVVHPTSQPWTLAHQERTCTGWLANWLTGWPELVAGSVVGRGRDARRTSCVIFARSGDPNVEPCRRAAVLQGQKDAATLSSASHACDDVESGSRKCRRTRVEVIANPAGRAGHGRVEMKRPSGSNICAALQCTPLCSGGCGAAEMAFAECSQSAVRSP